MLLKSELLGLEPPSRTQLPPEFYGLSTDDTDFFDPFSPPTARAMMSGASAFNFSTARGSMLGRCPLSSVGGSQNLLRFKAPRQSFHSEVKTSIPSFSSAASARPCTSGSQYSRRKFPKTPFKVLDAPSLQDDFYLNLVDWSSTNVLAVGLASSVYLWSACTSKVTKLCDLGAADLVASVSWSQRVWFHLVASFNRERSEISS
jgi:cell division cycle 20-like protein 1, cofactor of APC complex